MTHPVVLGSNQFMGWRLFGAPAPDTTSSTEESIVDDIGDLKPSMLLAAGGKLVLQTQKKPTKHPRCGATGVRLHGVSNSTAACDSISK